MGIRVGVGEIEVLLYARRGCNVGVAIGVVGSGTSVGTPERVGIGVFEIMAGVMVGITVGATVEEPFVGITDGACAMRAGLFVGEIGAAFAFVGISVGLLGEPVLVGAAVGLIDVSD